MTEQRKVGETKLELFITDDNVWFNADDTISTLRSWANVNNEQPALRGLLRQFVKLNNKHKKKKNKMTKDEFFHKAQVEHNPYYPEQGYPVDTLTEIFGSAMDEYAKQQAIAFMKASLENWNLRPDEAGSVQLDYNYAQESTFPKVAGQLYDQFIEQQNK
jgi:hypothetical protein